MESSQSIPKHLEKEFKRTQDLVRGFCIWITFCHLDTARDSEFKQNHLLSFLSQDILETLMGVCIQVKEGIHNPVIRESRYLLELSIKMAVIQQLSYRSSIDKKIQEFNKIIKSPNISMMKKLKFHFLKADTREEFLEYVGRLYGMSSNFVHVTAQSIKFRLERLEEDRMLGDETEEDLKNLNDFLQQIYAASLVFIAHSVPEYVIGDWHVSNNEEGEDAWYYMKSKYIAEIDSYFDYKFERKHVLQTLIKERALNIEF